MSKTPTCPDFRVARAGPPVAGWAWLPHLPLCLPLGPLCSRSPPSSPLLTESRCLGSLGARREGSPPALLPER